MQLRLVSEKFYVFRVSDDKKIRYIKYAERSPLFPFLLQHVKYYISFKIMGPVLDLYRHTFDDQC
jgi:hypothetical protein